MGSGKQEEVKKTVKKPAESAEETHRKEEEPAAAAEESKGGKKKKEDKKKEKSLPDKTLCKLVKSDYVKDHFKEYQKLVADGEYVCRKCGRVAKNKRSLCSPARLG